MPDPLFTACLRPDCSGPPRYCSTDCARNMDGSPSVAALEDALTAANVNLAHALALLRKAGSALAITAGDMDLDEEDQRLIPEIAQFLSRLP